MRVTARKGSREGPQLTKGKGKQRGEQQLERGATWVTAKELAQHTPRRTASHCS